MFYIIHRDLLPVQNGVDSHVAAVGVHTKYVERRLVDAGSCQRVLYLRIILFIGADLKSQEENQGLLNISEKMNEPVFCNFYPA